MSKMLITLFITILQPFVLYAQELPTRVGNKPICNMLSPVELAQKNKTKPNYRTYHDYLYSRSVLKPRNTSIKEILLSDHFSYPEINRWVQITKWMNKNHHAESGEINLPPCQTIDNQEFPSEPLIPVIIAPKILPKKKVIRPKRLSIFHGTSLGSVSVKSNDDLNSKFELLFLKFTLSANYKLVKDTQVYGGIGLNNYLYVKFFSDAGKAQSNQIKPYWDYNGGLSKKISRHLFSLQYDNMNVLLNQNNTTEFRLTPARVDRIAVMDNYKINKNFSIFVSFGFFHPLFSQASGFDVGVGPRFEAADKFSIYFRYSFNELYKDDLKNTSQAFVLGTNYRF